MRTLTKISCVLIAVTTLLTACAKQTPRPAPKFTGRLLLLSGDHKVGADLVELSPAAAGPTYNTSILAGGVIEAVPAPDQTGLLYATKSEILLRDRAGATKSLVKGENFCLSWAPDGNHFSYKQRSATSTKLYFSDLEGKSKLIWEDVTGAAADCGHWIGPNRFIFDRFLGGAVKPQKTGEPLKPNTTTVATLSDSVKLADTDRKWSIDGVCTSGNGVILRPHDQGQPVLAAKNLDQLKTLDPSPISCSDCRFIGFAAKSCVPFFIEPSSSTSMDVFSLNPMNWQRQKGGHIGQVFSGAASMLIKSSARLMIVGDAPATLMLVDTESGESMSLAPTSGNALVSPIPVLWIET